jgi:hypothetical protein
MIELGVFTTKDGRNYYGHYYPENNLVEAVGPLPADRDFGARGVAFSAPATSEEDARNKILHAIKQGQLR